MNTKEPALPIMSGNQSDQSVVVKHIQPVQTSGGRDLAQDLVWQRDPDCSKESFSSQPTMAGQGQPGIQSSVGFPASTGTQALPQTTLPFNYQVQSVANLPSPSGIAIPTSMVQTFQQPNAYAQSTQANVVTFMPVANTQTVFVDTDGNRIQQSPMVPQNFQYTGFQLQSNMVPVQVNPSNTQYVSIAQPTAIGHQQGYPRLVPYNQQTMGNLIGRPSNLNVTMANQATPTVVSGSQVSSPTMTNTGVMTGPVAQSPTVVTSPGTESVKSPTYVFMCNKCNYVTPHRSSFKTHYSSHIQYKPYQCAYCDHQTIMKQPMQKHVKMKHAIEDSEGFRYESDSKKENIIEFFSKQCRSTMNLEEAKTYMSKFEASNERKPKPGPAKRKLSKEFQNEEDESELSSKRKKNMSEKNDDDEEESEDDENQDGRKKSPVSPRKLTHWKQDPTRNPQNVRKPGRPRKTFSESSESDTRQKSFMGNQKKFVGFGKRRKHWKKVMNNLLCQYCEFKSASAAGLKKHCIWRHPDKKINCTKCSYYAYFEEELEKHLNNNQCENDNTVVLNKRERSKSPEKSVGRPRKSLSTTEQSKQAPAPDLEMENSDESGNDDVQLNCPHCNFVSHALALKRHLFFYHKECDWRCKHCGFISGSKKEVVRHSNKEHVDVQPNVVQTFADISSLLPDNATEQEKTTPPDKDISEKDKLVSKHHMLDRDFIKTSRKKLTLGKKRVSKITTDQSESDGKIQVTKGGPEKKSPIGKRGRKREEKGSKDQNAFVVRPKKLKVAAIGFSCVYCTYAAPLRHQLRLHCYEKHTKHPACLMEFVNSKMAVLEEQVNLPRDMTEDRKKTDQNDDDLSGKKEENKSTEVKSSNPEESKVETNTEQNMDVDDGNMNSGKKESDICNVSKNDEITQKSNATSEEKTVKSQEEPDNAVILCMENILSNISPGDNGGVDNLQSGNNGSQTINYILPSKINGHKFSNPFSTLIVQLNSFEIKVKDAFEGSLDDVDVYLEKFGVRTLNMDSLTPKQFAVFMRKFGNNLQPLNL